MTLRIDSSTASIESASFSPTTEWFVQAQIPHGSPACVTIEGRVSTDAPWVYLGAIYAVSQQPVLRFAAVPYARVTLSSNTDLSAIKVWSSV